MHSFQMGQVLGSGGVEIISEAGGEEEEQEMVKQVRNFSSLPTPKFPKQGNKNEAKTNLESWDLGAPERDPAHLFSARKFS